MYTRSGTATTYGGWHLQRLEEEEVEEEEEEEEEEKVVEEEEEPVGAWEQGQQPKIEKAYKL